MKALKIRRALHIVLMLAIAAVTATAQPAVREIPNYQLNDIAVATYDQYGPVIYYNPTIAEAVGPLVSLWFRAHEYGHIYLGHVSSPLSQLEKERQADYYATMSLIHYPHVLEAAIAYFESRGYITDGLHDPSIQRAANIRQWMKQSRMF